MRIPLRIPRKLSGRSSPYSLCKTLGNEWKPGRKVASLEGFWEPKQGGGPLYFPHKNLDMEGMPHTVSPELQREGMLQVPQQCLWEPGQRQRGSPQFPKAGNKSSNPSMKAVLASEVRETLRTDAFGDY